MCPSPENDRAFQNKCLEYIAKHPELAKTEVFDSLSESLKVELADLLSWDARATQASIGDAPEEVNQIVDMTMGLRLLPVRPSLAHLVFLTQSLFQETTSPPEDDDLQTVPLTHDSWRLEHCVAQLRDVLGPLIAQESLVRVALAADYDVNRALNHFFGEGAAAAADDEEEENVL